MALEYNVTWGDLIARDLNSRFLDRTRQISTVTQGPAAEADREIEHLTNIQLSMSMAVYTEALIDNLATTSENYARDAANIPSQFRNPEYEQRTRQMLQDMIQAAPRFSLLQQLHYFESSFSFLSGRLNQLRAIPNPSAQDQADIRQFSMWIGQTPNRATFTGVFGKRIQALRQQLRTDHNQVISVRNERGDVITFNPIDENISAADLFREIRRMEQWFKGQFLVTADVEIPPRQRGGVTVRSRPHIAHAMYFSAQFNYRTHLGDRIANGNAPPEELLRAITTDEQIAERFRQYIGNTLQLQRDFIILAAHRGSLFPEAATKVTASLSPEEKAKYESMHLAGHGFDHLLMSQQDTLDVYTRTLLDQVLAFSTVPVLLDGMIGAVDRLVGGLDAFVLHLLQIGQGFNNYATTLFGGPWLLPLVRSRLGTNAELAAHLRSEANRLRGLRERLSKIRDETEKKITEVRNQMPKLISNLREASNRLDRATTTEERLKIRNECVNIVSQIHTQYDGLVDTVVNLDVRLTNGRAFHAENAAALREANSLHVAAAIASDALLFIILRRLGANGGLLGRGGVLDQYRIVRMARGTPIVGDVIEAFNAQTRPAVGLFNWARRTITGAPLPEATPALPPNVQKTLNSTTTRLQQIETELDAARRAGDQKKMADLIAERRRLGEQVTTLLEGAPDGAKQAFARQMLGAEVIGRLSAAQLKQLNNAIIEIHNIGAGKSLTDMIDFNGTRMTVLHAKTIRMRQLLMDTDILSYREARQLMSGFCGSAVTEAAEAFANVASRAALLRLRTQLSVAGANIEDALLAARRAGLRELQGLSDSQLRNASRSELFQRMMSRARNETELAQSLNTMRRAVLSRPTVSSYVFTGLDAIGLIMAWQSWLENGRNIERAIANGNPALRDFYQQARVVDAIFIGVTTNGLAFGGVAIYGGLSSTPILTTIGTAGVGIAAVPGAFLGARSIMVDATGLSAAAERMNLNVRDWQQRSIGQILAELERLSLGRNTEGEMSGAGGTTILENIPIFTLSPGTRLDLGGGIGNGFVGLPGLSQGSQVDSGIKKLEESNRAARTTLCNAYILRTSYLPRRPQEADRSYGERLSQYVNRQMEYLRRITNSRYNLYRPDVFRDAQRFADLMVLSEENGNQTITVEVNGQPQQVPFSQFSTLPFRSPTGALDQVSVLSAYRGRQQTTNLLQLLLYADPSEGESSLEAARRRRDMQETLHAILLNDIRGDIDRFLAMVEGFDFNGMDITIFGIGPRGETNARNRIRYGVSRRLQQALNRVEPRILELVGQPGSDPERAGQLLQKTYNDALEELRGVLRQPPGAVRYTGPFSGESIRGTSSAMQTWSNEIFQELSKERLLLQDMSNSEQFFDFRNFTRASVTFVERQGREIIRQALSTQEFPLAIENPGGSFTFSWRSDYRALDELQIECLDGVWRYRMAGTDHPAYTEWREVREALPQAYTRNFTQARGAGLEKYNSLLARLARLTGRA